MRRTARHIRSSENGKKHIYIDEANWKDILKYVTQDGRHRNKFRHITDLILGNLRNPDLYDKEDFNGKCKDVTAMKFFKGQENDRIYCKEISGMSPGHVVICCVLHEKKKSQKLSKREKNIIETVAKYEYELKGTENHQTEL